MPFFFIHILCVCVDNDDALFMCRLTASINSSNSSSNRKFHYYRIMSPSQIHDIKHNDLHINSMENGNFSVQPLEYLFIARCYSLFLRQLLLLLLLFLFLSIWVFLFSCRSHHSFQFCSFKKWNLYWSEPLSRH